MNFLMNESTFSVILITLLLSYFITNSIFSYLIIKDESLGNFQRLLLVALFWFIPFSGFVIYPVHLFIKRRQLA